MTPAEPFFLAKKLHNAEENLKLNEKHPEIVQLSKVFAEFVQSLLSRPKTMQPSFVNLSVPDKDKIAVFRQWSHHTLSVCIPGLEVLVSSSMDQLLDKLPLTGVAYVQKFCTILLSCKRYNDSKRVPEVIAFLLSCGDIAKLEAWNTLSVAELQEVTCVSPRLAVENMDVSLTDPEIISPFAEMFKETLEYKTKMHPFAFTKMAASVSVCLRSSNKQNSKVSLMTIMKLLSESVVALARHQQEQASKSSLPPFVLYTIMHIAQVSKHYIPEHMFQQKLSGFALNERLQQVSRKPMFGDNDSSEDVISKLFSSMRFQPNSHTWQSNITSNHMPEMQLKFLELASALQSDSNRFFSLSYLKSPTNYFEAVAGLASKLTLGKQFSSMRAVLNYVRCVHNREWRKDRRDPTTVQNYYASRWYSPYMNGDLLTPLIQLVDELFSKKLPYPKSFAGRNTDHVFEADLTWPFLSQEVGGWTTDAAKLICETTSFNRMDEGMVSFRNFVYLANSMRETPLWPIRDTFQIDLYKKMMIIVLREYQPGSKAAKIMQSFVLWMIRGVLLLRLRTEGCNYIDYKTFCKEKLKTKLDDNSLDGQLNKSLLTFLGALRGVDLIPEFTVTKDIEALDFYGCFVDKGKYLDFLEAQQKKAAETSPRASYLNRGPNHYESWQKQVKQIGLTEVTGMEAFDTYAVHENLMIIMGTEILLTFDGIGPIGYFHECKIWTSAYLQTRTGTMRLFQASGAKSATLAFKLAQRGYDILFIPYQIANEELPNQVWKVKGMIQDYARKYKEAQEKAKTEEQSSTESQEKPKRKRSVSKKVKSTESTV